MSLRTLRLAAIILPAALLLHEGAYALAGGGLIGGVHGYLELAIPLGTAFAASLAIAAILLPALGVRRESSERWAPFALAGALAAVFVAQELAEAALMGGGWNGLVASLAVSWLVPPLALVLGALASALVISLDRAGELLADLACREDVRSAPVGTIWQPGRSPFVPAAACAGLSFGAARRPPPVRA